MKKHLFIFSLIAITAGIQAAASMNNDQLLIKASRDNDIAEVKRLLRDPKTNINFKDFFGKTALMIAAKNNNKKVVMLLLDAGADITIKDRTFKTAAQIARKIGNMSLANLIEYYPSENQ